MMEVERPVAPLNQQVTLKENFLIMVQVFRRPGWAFERISANGKDFYLGALSIIVVSGLLSFLGGFTTSNIFDFAKDIASVFLNAGLLLFFGKWLFKGQGTYWGLFSSLGYVRVALLPMTILVALGVLFLYLGSFVSAVNPLLVFIAVSSAVIISGLSIMSIIYSLILAIAAVSRSLKISGGRAFGLMIIVGIIGMSLTWGVNSLISAPSVSFVGQAIHFLP